MFNSLLVDVVVVRETNDDFAEVELHRCFLDLLVVAEGVVVDDAGDLSLLVVEGLEDTDVDAGNLVEEAVSDCVVIEVLGESVLEDAVAVDESVVDFNVLFNVLLD